MSSPPPPARLPSSSPGVPPWDRPDNVLGEPVALHVLLARTELAAIQLQHVTAFPTGFEFQLVARCSPSGEVWDPMHGLMGLRGRPGEAVPKPFADHLRLRIRFANGSEANNLGPPMMQPDDPTGSGPFLRACEGSGRPSVAEVTYWVWPLPPPGLLVFGCEWPKYSIPSTESAVDADLIREAATRAVELWPAATEQA